MSWSGTTRGDISLHGLLGKTDGGGLSPSGPPEKTALLWKPQQGSDDLSTRSHHAPVLVPVALDKAVWLSG